MPECCASIIGKQLKTPGAKSKYSSSTGVSQLSTACGALDSLFFKHNTYVWTGGNLIIVEIGPDIVVTDGKKARSIGIVGPLTVLYCDVFFELEYGNNDEMLQLLQSFSKINGLFAEEDVVKFCDSYYHHRVKKSYSIETDDTLTLPEVEAAIRSGGFKKAKFLDGIKGLPETRFKNLPKDPVVKKEKKQTKKIDDGAFLKRCKHGEFIVPYEWREEDKSNIPPLSFLDKMVENDTFRKLVTKVHFRTERILKRMSESKEMNITDEATIIGEDAINVSLVGKPGTGKSFVAHALGSATGMPVSVVNCSENTDEDRFEGMTKIVDGKPAAVPTEVITRFQNGGILILEEVNLLRPATIMGAMGQALVFPYILKQYGYRDIKRHPLCIIISTMNIGTAGTKTVAQQFANRFKQSYQMDDPEKDQFIKRLMMMTGEDYKLCAWIYMCYEKITKCIREEAVQADPDSILAALSVRTCVGAIENIQEGSDAKEAVTDSIIGKVREQDSEVARLCEQILDNIRDYNPNISS